MYFMIWALKIPKFWHFHAKIPGPRAMGHCPKMVKKALAKESVFGHRNFPRRDGGSIELSLIGHLAYYISVGNIAIYRYIGNLLKNVQNATFMHPYYCFMLLFACEWLKLWNL